MAEELRETLGEFRRILRAHTSWFFGIRPISDFVTNPSMIRVPYEKSDFIDEIKKRKDCSGILFYDDKDNLLWFNSEMNVIHVYKLTS